MLQLRFLSARWWWKQRESRMVNGNGRMKLMITAELEAEIKGYIHTAGGKQTWGIPYVQDGHFHRNTCVSCPATKQLYQICSDKPDMVLRPEEVVMLTVATAPTSIYELGEYDVFWPWTEGKEITECWHFKAACSFSSSRTTTPIAAQQQRAGTPQLSRLQDPSQYLTGLSFPCGSLHQKYVWFRPSNSHCMT